MECGASTLNTTAFNPDISIHRLNQATGEIYNPRPDPRTILFISLSSGTNVRNEVIDDLRINTFSLL